MYILFEYNEQFLPAGRFSTVGSCFKCSFNTERELTVNKIIL